MTLINKKEIKRIRPKVSIGMPVFNGESFIENAINSILSQTFKDFELVISDNNSDDKTEEICKQFLLQDERVKYIKHEKNQGAMNNFMFAFNSSSGDYFMWAAADDFYHKDHIKNLFTLLDNDLDASVAMSAARCLDEKNNLISEVTYETSLFKKINNFKVSKKLATGYKLHYFIYGLWKRNSLEKLMPLIDCRYGDRVFILLASIKYYFVYSPKPTYFRRIQSELSYKKYAKTDPKLAKQYSSNIESFKSVLFFFRRLQYMKFNNMYFKSTLLLFFYSSWIIYGTFYDSKIGNLMRVIYIKILRKSK